MLYSNLIFGFITRSLLLNQSNVLTFVLVFVANEERTLNIIFMSAHVHAVCVSDPRGDLPVIIQRCQMSDRSMFIASTAAVCLCIWLRLCYYEPLHNLFLCVYICRCACVSLFTTPCWFAFMCVRPCLHVLSRARVCVPVRTRSYRMLFGYLMHAVYAMREKRRTIGLLWSEGKLEILILLSEKWQILKGHFTHVVMLPCRPGEDQISDVDIVL